MRRTALVAMAVATAVLAACGGGGPSEEDLRASVGDLWEEGHSLDANAVWAAQSSRCRQVDPLGMWQERFSDLDPSDGAGETMSISGIVIDGDRATVTLAVRAGDGAEPSTQRWVAEDGAWKYNGCRSSWLAWLTGGTTPTSTTTTTPSSTSTTSSSSTSTTTTTTTPVEPSFTEFARITTWYSAAEADDSAWVHFKAVDSSGSTVQEALGSDLMNLVDEADGAAQTAERLRLVDELRQMMAADGWTETGVDGEWYEYTFGR